jgi:hypothetical protein
VKKLQVSVAAYRSCLLSLILGDSQSVRPHSVLTNIQPMGILPISILLTDILPDGILHTSILPKVILSMVILHADILPTSFLSRGSFPVE